MKKILILMIVLSCTLAAQEQTSKGSTSLGGKVSFSSLSDGGYTLSTFEVSPQISTFAWPDVELGISISSVTQTANSRTFSQTGIGPFMNFYLTDERVKPLIGFSYTINITSTGGNSHSLGQITFQGGLSVPLNAKVALVPLAQYSFYTGEHADQTRLFSIGAGIKAFL